MGPGVWAARRSALLLWRRAACPLAGRAAAPARRPPVGPADLLRGLHRAPQPEERPAGEGGPRPGAADHSGPKFDIDMLVSLLRQENARDICVIKVPPEMRYTDYFVIGSGTSTRHLHAMAYYIVKMYKYLKNKSESHVKIEGKDTDDWMCVDFGSMVVHLMLPETRETYELEKLWTLRSYDDQLAEIPPETLPQDFILGIEDTSFPTPVDLKCE